MQTFIQALSNSAIEVQNFKAIVDEKSHKTSHFGSCAVPAFFAGLGSLTFNADSRPVNIKINGKKQNTIADTVSIMPALTSSDWDAVQFMSHKIIKATSLLFIGTEQNKQYLHLLIAYVLLSGTDISKYDNNSTVIKSQVNELITQSELDQVPLNSYIAAKCVDPERWQTRYDKWCKSVFSGYAHNPKIANIIALDRLSQFVEASESIGQSIEHSAQLSTLYRQSLEGRGSAPANHNLLGLAKSAFSGVNNWLGTANNAVTPKASIDLPSGSANKWYSLLKIADSVSLTDLLPTNDGAA